MFVLLWFGGCSAMICLFVLPWCVCLVRHGFYGLLVGLFCLCVCSVLRFGYATKRGDPYHPEHPRAPRNTPGAPPSTPEYPGPAQTTKTTATTRRPRCAAAARCKWEYGLVGVRLSGSTAKWEYGLVGVRLSGSTAKWEYGLVGDGQVGVPVSTADRGCSNGPFTIPSEARPLPGALLSTHSTQGAVSPPTGCCEYPNGVL